MPYLSDFYISNPGALTLPVNTVTYNDGGTTNLDHGLGNVFSLTANGTGTTIGHLNVPSERYSFELHLQWTAGTITWPTSWTKGDAPPSATGNYVITGITVDGGISWKISVLALGYTVVLDVPMSADFNDVTGRHTVTTNGNVVISNDLGEPWGKFDGSGDFLSIADSDDFNWDEAFTLSADIHRTKTTRSFVFSHRFDGNNSHSIDVDYSDADDVFVAGFSGMNPISTGLVTLPVNTSYSIALTYDGVGTFKFAVDGVIKTTASATPGTTNVASTFYIGRIAAATTLDWGGYMRNFKIIKGKALY